MKFLINILLSLFFLTFFGCKSKLSSEKEFYKYWSDSSNGLFHKKSVNGFELTMKYMPHEYLMFNEIQNKPIGEKEYEELKKKYANTLSFLMTIAPESSTNFSSTDQVEKYNIGSLEEFKDRMLELNFGMKEYIHLKTSAGEKYHPILATMENVYTLDNKKNIVIVFGDIKEGKSILENEKLDVVFEDKMFDTGINHFVFEKENLLNIPELTFINKKAI